MESIILKDAINEINREDFNLHDTINSARILARKKLSTYRDKEGGESDNIADTIKMLISAFFISEEINIDFEKIKEMFIRFITDISKLENKQPSSPISNGIGWLSLVNDAKPDLTVPLVLASIIGAVDLASDGAAIPNLDEIIKDIGVARQIQELRSGIERAQKQAQIKNKGEKMKNCVLEKEIEELKKALQKNKEVSAPQKNHDSTGQKLLYVAGGVILGLGAVCAWNYFHGDGFTVVKSGN